MNKVHNIDVNIIKKKNKLKIFTNARLNIKKLFLNKINYNQDVKNDVNKIKIKNNCLKNLFIKFSPKYKYNN